MKHRYVVGLDKQQNQWYVMDVQTFEVELCSNYATAKYTAVTKNTAYNRSEVAV